MQTPLCAYHFIDTLLNYKTTLFDYIFVTQFTLIRIITVQMSYFCHLYHDIKGIILSLSYDA